MDAISRPEHTARAQNIRCYTQIEQKIARSLHTSENSRGNNARRSQARHVLYARQEGPQDVGSNSASGMQGCTYRIRAALLLPRRSRICPGESPDTSGHTEGRERVSQQTGACAPFRIISRHNAFVRERTRSHFTWSRFIFVTTYSPKSTSTSTSTSAVEISTTPNINTCGWRPMVFSNDHARRLLRVPLGIQRKLGIRQRGSSATKCFRRET